MLWQTEVSVLNKKLFSIIILLVVAILSPYNLFKRFILLLVFLLLAQFHLVQINSLNWYTVNLIRNDITYVIEIPQIFKDLEGISTI